MTEPERSTSRPETAAQSLPVAVSISYAYVKDELEASALLQRSISASPW
jgi:hypothetical protein